MVPIWCIVIGVTVCSALIILYKTQQHTRHTNNTNIYLDYPANGGDSHGSTCSICLNNGPNRSMTSLICGHSFHPRCIDNWFESSSHSPSVCPICFTLA